MTYAISNHELTCQVHFGFAGPAAKLPFLNLHWYVYSLGTPVTWTFHDPQLGPETLSGQGWAHMEKDWGRAFPNKWVWAQGMKLSEQSDKETAPQVWLRFFPLPVCMLSFLLLI